MKRVMTCMTALPDGTYMYVLSCDYLLDQHVETSYVASPGFLMGPARESPLLVSPLTRCLQLFSTTQLCLSDNVCLSSTQPLSRACITPKRFYFKMDEFWSRDQTRTRTADHSRKSTVSRSTSPHIWHPDTNGPLSISPKQIGPTGINSRSRMSYFTKTRVCRYHSRLVCALMFIACLSLFSCGILLQLLAVHMETLWYVDLVFLDDCSNLCLGSTYHFPCILVQRRHLHNYGSAECSCIPTRLVAAVGFGWPDSFMVAMGSHWWRPSTTWQLARFP